MEWIHNLAEWTLKLAETSYGAWGLFGIAFAESSFFPIPPDLLQIALSVMRPEKALVYALISLSGSVAGAALGYAIGLFGGRPLVRRLLSDSKMELIETYFRKYDVWAVGIAGFTPIPYKVFTISGGAFKISFFRFMMVSILSRGARFFAVGLAFFIFGEEIQDVIFRNLNLFSVIFIVLLVGGFVLISVLSKSLRQNSRR